MEIQLESEERRMVVIAWKDCHGVGLVTGKWERIQKGREYVVVKPKTIVTVELKP